MFQSRFFDGSVLWFSKGKSSTIKLKDSSSIEAFASESLDDLITFSFHNNLIGLEWAGGLPSTIGGAIQGNAGAFGGEIRRSVDKVEVFEIGSSGGFVQKIFEVSELESGYRKRRREQLLSHLPNLNRYYPTTDKETKEFMEKEYNREGPSFMRL